MTKMSIDQITVGDRRREDMGDIAALAASIQKYGLIHAIVVDPHGKLIAGGRRLAACKSLGMKWVEVRQWDELTDAELREIELEENLLRKDLTPYEQNRTLVDLIEVAAEIDRSQPPPCADSAHGGRFQSQPGSRRRAADRVGVPEATVREAEKHVTTAEAFPVFQGPDWKQYHVLEAREALDKLPEPERPIAVSIIDQPGIPPRDAIKVLKNVAAMPEPERHEVLVLAQSSDSRDRSLAQTRGAALPPMPDPRIALLHITASKFSRFVREFPDDPHNPRIESLIRDIRSIAADIKEAS